MILQANNEPNAVALHVAHFEYEKVLIEKSLLEGYVLFNIEHPIPLKGSIAHPVVGPWTFYVRECDLKKAQEIIDSLPLEPRVEIKQISRRERVRVHFIFYICLIAALAFLYLSLRQA